MAHENPTRLVDILRALPPRELDAIVARLGLRIDPAKRIDPPSQVARALVNLADLRDPSRLPTASVELLHRVAEARGSLVVPAIPPAIEPLLARGLLFARSAEDSIELVLPTAYLLQLRPWEGEDPRGMRALLAQASQDTLTAIASHYLGRPATTPVVLCLEQAWDILSNSELLTAEIARLSVTERRVMEGVEVDGGEVDTEELLELEREPLRLRTATGATPSRRGVGFSLERRGFLIPVHPNRHVIPSAVSAIIGAAHHQERQAHREEIRAFVTSGDHAPHRARFALDPAPSALGLSLAAREQGTEFRAGIGTPKSLVQKLAARVGREPAHVALLVALSRAVGIWDPSATNISAPPGSFTVQELTRELFVTWRRGGAWDEAREEAEVLRLGPEARDTSPAGVVRELVLEALQELGEGRWLPWSALERYLSTDHRAAGLTRLLRRWAERVGAAPVSPVDIAYRIVHESLPALGLVDLGDEPEGDERSVTLRMTPRGRALLAGKLPSMDVEPSKFLEAHVLRLGPSARVGTVLTIAPLVEVGRVAETLDLIVAPQSLARALAAGLEADVLRARIEALAELPESLVRTLAQASVVLARTTFAAAGGFLWVEDSNVRELLRTRRPTAELFVDPSPPGGLLVQASVDLERLARRCRTLGVEIVAEGQVVRIRSVPPPKSPAATRGGDRGPSS